MSKTIKQIADELGVSKQAVQKRIAREPLCTSLQPYIYTKDNVKYIEVVGENLVKAAFSKSGIDNVHIDKGIDKSIDKISLEKLVKYLEKENERLLDEVAELKLQLAEEREQNRQNAAELRSLSATVGNSLQQLTAGQTADKQKLLVDTMQQAIIQEPPPKRWQLWKRRKGS